MKICVYGAASTKLDREYIEAGEELGREMAKRGHDLVFGAGGNGLMGAVARGVKECGGKVIGVIPEFFRDEEIEAIYDECDEIIYTKTMHERKMTMETLADAFIVTPGGIGTFEEFFETLTLKQLSRHTKPIGVYNVKHYYDPLETMMYLAMREKFVRAYCDLLYLVFTDLDEMFEYVENKFGSFGLTVKDLKDG